MCVGRERERERVQYALLRAMAARTHRMGRSPFPIEANFVRTGPPTLDPCLLCDRGEEKERRCTHVHAATRPGLLGEPGRLQAHTNCDKRDIGFGGACQRRGTERKGGDAGVVDGQGSHWGIKTYHGAIAAILTGEAVKNTAASVHNAAKLQSNPERQTRCSTHLEDFTIERPGLDSILAKVLHTERNYEIIRKVCSMSDMPKKTNHELLGPLLVRVGQERHFLVNSHPGFDQYNFDSTSSN